MTFPWAALAAEYLPRPGELLDEELPGPWYDLLAVGVYPNVELAGHGPEQITVTTYRWANYPVVWGASVEADDVITGFDDLQDIVRQHATWGSWRLRHRAGAHVPLSDLHHDHPVFSRNDNLAFRAWHDTAHLRHGLSFSALDELCLFGRQAVEVLDGDDVARRRRAVDALFCESVYQLAAAVTLGTYPDRQYCRPVGPVGAVVRDVLIGLAS